MTARVCTKRRFNTWDEAHAFVLEAKLTRLRIGKHHTRRREERVYYCHECLCHHVTSNPGRAA